MGDLFDNSIESSGLIDIRNLATLALAEKEENDIDEIIAIGSAASSLFVPPVLATYKKPRIRRKLVIGIVAAAFIGCFAFLVLIGIRVKSARAAEKEQQIATLTAELVALRSDNAKQVLAPALPALVSTINDEEESGKDLEPATVKEEFPETPKEIRKGRDGVRERRRKQNKSHHVSANDEQDEVPGEVEKDVASKDTPSELDILLSAPAPKNLPEKLTKPQVVAGMKAVKSSVLNCGKGQSGTVTVRANIRPSGSVSTAVTTGAFAGTPAGTCAARAVRRAKFPKTKNSLKVSYPFRL